MRLSSVTPDLTSVYIRREVQYGHGEQNILPVMSNTNSRKTSVETVVNDEGNIWSTGNKIVELNLRKLGQCQEEDPSAVEERGECWAGPS